MKICRFSGPGPQEGALVIFLALKGLKNNSDFIWITLFAFKWVCFEKSILGKFKNDKMSFSKWQ